MDQIYSNKMAELGYNQLVCDIFIDWESVKDEILIPERKVGSGNGTIHVFLGAADSKLKQEFASYYENVNTGANPESDAVEVCHYFMVSNVISMLGYVCKYHYDNHEEIVTDINSILSVLSSTTNEKGLLKTKSLFKLSLGSNKLRPYFKQFDSDGVFIKLIRRILLPNSSYKISLYKNNVGEYAAFWLIGFDWQSDFEANSNNWYTSANKLLSLSNSPLQCIYYGAPGTGKSNEIKKQTVGKSVIRTTFHPDSDYSTFVGAYKPTTLEKPVTTAIGTKLVLVEDPKGNHISETIITYDYVPQAFLQAYIKAWKFMSNTNEDGKIEEQFLVIEEINRGNCAQIFGDLFQLLDRNDNGFSEYPINADKDIEKYIKKAFDEEKVNINASISSEFEEYEGDISSDIQNGKVLVLPQNLYIWATMNTSDQSLFPMDSAFKRRWDWKYMPINVRKESWAIEVQGVKYSWSSFLEKINDEIGDTTSSEDKKLGFYFCKAKDNVISSERFVSKVLFYIYNDVFKDYEFCRDFFKDEDGKTINFQKFFFDDGSINEVAVRRILENLKVEKFDDINSDITEDIDDVLLDENGNDTTSSSLSKDMSRYSINGFGRYSKGETARKSVEIYVNGNPRKADYEIVADWRNLKINVPNLIETQSEHEGRRSTTTDARFDERSRTVQHQNGSLIYVSNQFNTERINDFITKVNAQSWGIKIEKVS